MKLVKLLIYVISITTLIGCEKLDLVNKKDEILITCSGKSNWYGPDYRQYYKDKDVEETYKLTNNSKEPNSWTFEIDGGKIKFKSYTPPFPEISPYTGILVTPQQIELTDFKVFTDTNTEITIKINRESGKWKYSSVTKPNNSVEPIRSETKDGKCDKKSQKF